MNQINRRVLDGRSGQSPASEPDTEVDLLSVFRVVWRGRAWVVLGLLVGLALGYVKAQILSVPVYQATTTIKLEGEETAVAGLPSLTATNDFWNQGLQITEIGVIESYTLAERLVLDLGLMNDPYFNPYIEPQGAGSDATSATGDVDEPLPSQEEILYQIAEQVRSKVSVSNPDWSNLLEISVRDTDAERAALMSNTLAELYIRDQIEVRFQRTREAKNWLSDETARLKSDLETASREIEAFRARTDLQSEETLAALNLQLKTLRERAVEAERRVVALEEDEAILLAAQQSGALDEQVAAIETVTGRSPRTDLESAGAEQVAVFAVEYDAALEGVRRGLSRQRGQSATLQQSLERQEAVIEQQSQEYVELRQMEREVEAGRLIYEYFLARLKEASVKEGFAQASARILSPAFIGAQIAPNTLRTIFAFGIFGLLIGSGAVLLRDRLRDTYRLGEDLEHDTALPVLGQIPAIPGKSRQELISYVVGKPGSAPAEAVRGLRTSLQHSSIDAPPRVVLMTSSVPGEGKTVTSVALAHHYAGLGKAVLLIEGDARRRAFDDIFPVPPEHSLLSVLSGDVGLLEAVHGHPSLGIDILSSGETTANPVDIFSSHAFACLLDASREAYDVILIDTPPLLLVPDARVIGQYADAILFMVQWDRTRRAQVRDALTQLRLAGLSPDGLVLSNIDVKRMQAYGHGERYGAYSAKGAGPYYKD